MIIKHFLVITAFCATYFIYDWLHYILHFGRGGAINTCDEKNNLPIKLLADPGTALQTVLLINSVTE